MRKSNIKKVFVIILMILICIATVAGYKCYQNYRMKKLLTSLTEETVSSIGITITVRDSEIKQIFLTEKDRITDILELLKAAEWKYSRHEMGGGYYFNPTISFCVFWNGKESGHFDIKRQRLNIYAIISAEEDYGVYILSETEGQKLIDFVMEMEQAD